MHYYKHNLHKNLKVSTGSEAFLKNLTSSITNTVTAKATQTR